MSENLPPLARLLGLVERHFLKALAAGAALALGAGFAIDMHAKAPPESFGGFYALAGFVSLSVVLIVARLLRALLGRQEDYYGRSAVNAEQYPADQLEVRDREP